MEKLVAFYFSGTGNTLYITDYLCKRLSGKFSCRLIDITGGDVRPEVIDEADIVLFAFPIYGSAPPIPMRNFVAANGKKLKGKKVVIVETQYFYSGDGAASLGRAIERFGGNIVGAEMFNMPNNLSDCKIFPVKNGADIKSTLARAEKRADAFADKIIGGRICLRGFSVLSHAVGYFSQRVFWRKAEKEKRGKLSIDPTRCVGCGLCSSRCPVGNIELKNQKAIPLGRCVLCYRCVNLCPKKAIRLIGSNPPTTQYKGPRL